MSPDGAVQILKLGCIQAGNSLGSSPPPSKYTFGHYPPEDPRRPRSNDSAMCPSAVASLSWVATSVPCLLAILTNSPDAPRSTFSMEMTRTKKTSLWMEEDTTWVPVRDGSPGTSRTIHLQRTHLPLQVTFPTWST